MEYNAPPGSQDPNAPYVNGIPGVQKGSPVNANAVEYPQREILAVIEAAGLTPTNNDLTQLLQAIQWHVSQRPYRRRLSSGIQFYITPTGSDANDGLSADTAFATTAGAVSAIASNYLISYPGVATINYSLGMHAPININGSLQQANIQNLFLAGSGVASTKTTAYSNYNNTMSVRVSGIAIDPGAAVRSFDTYNAQTIIDGPVSHTGYGQDAITHHFAELHISTTGQFTFNGSFSSPLNIINSAHFSYTGGAKIILNGITVGSTSAVFYLGNGSHMNGSAASFTTLFSGSATGRRFYVQTNSIIYSGGAGINSVPGTVAGIADTSTGGYFI